MIICGKKAYCTIALICGFFAAQGSAAAELTLAVANSMCGVMRQAGSVFIRQQPTELRFICKSSGRLAKGLAGKAITADVFVAANQAWMDHAVAQGLVDRAEIESLWGNKLVVAAPAASPINVNSLGDLTQSQLREIILGDPGTAPFGRYAKQALERAGIWDDIRSKVVTRKHITLAADSLSRAGDDTVGILFETSLDDTLKHLYAVPAADHDPIRYFSAPLGSASAKPEVRAFLAFLRSPSSHKVFRGAGFAVFE